jgi:hypothetical protein
MVHPKEKMKPLPESESAPTRTWATKAESPKAGVGVPEEILEPLTPILPRPAIHTAEMGVCHCVGSA